MHRLLPRTVTCLTLVLGVGPLSAQAGPTPLARAAFGKMPNALTATQQNQHSGLALSHALSLRGSLGLGSAESFLVERASVNPKGETFVSLQHTYQGHKVWNSRAVAKVSPQGTVALANAQAIVSATSLGGAPILSSSQASAAAVSALGTQVTLQGKPSVEQIAFSPKFIRETFVPIKRIPQPQAYIWAYQVHVNGRGPDGPVSTTYVIDGDTGLVLREDNQLVRATASPIPAMGTGLGYYSGQTPVPTTRMEDGTYALWDTTRGNKPNPSLLYNQLNAGWGAGTVWQPSGLQVWFEKKDATGADLYTQYLFQKDALAATPDFTDAWGDGRVWGGGWANEGLANGQTAGVDILHAMAATWDFYGNIFNRNGIDGLGTTPYAMALEGGPQDTGSYQTDVAAWDSGNFAMHFGAGSYPTNPAGQLSMSDFDIVAHEMAHGVTESTAAFDSYPPANVCDEPALNEGSADFLAQMAKAYSKLAPTADPFTIPNMGIDWTIGAGVNNGKPLRWITKPSKDGVSFDAHYDGMAYIDPHFSSGVLSRALYFLAQGASATKSDDSYSPFLPTGMTGVGNDHTARIWWKVLSENFLGHAFSSLQFKDARSAALGAAIDLFGEGSPEAFGVENAFAAVNVGTAHGGTPRTEVVFANWRPDTDWFKVYWYPWFANRQIFPMGETVPMKITVNNNANTKVTWSVGGPSMFRGQTPGGGTQEGGKINADGTWTIPNVSGKYAITATSVADPSQFAEGRAIAIHFDCDSDGENDAMDMAALGLEWLLPRYLDLNQSVYPGLGVDDSDVAFMVDAIKNAWPAE